MVKHSTLKLHSTNKSVISVKLYCAFAYLVAVATTATLFALKSYEKLIDKGLSNNEK